MCLAATDMQPPRCMAVDMALRTTGTSCYMLTRLCDVCSHYHASLAQQEREDVQAAWTHDRVQIIVATIAFGMGAVP